MVQITAPVNTNSADLFMSIGERFKEERERLGLSQPAFAAVAGAAKRTLIDWEKGATSPSAVQLAALSGIGADVLYILTGQRSASALTADELELLERFRAASLDGKAAAMGALRGIAQTAPKIHVGTNKGQVVEGGLTQEGPVIFGGTYKEIK